MDHEKGKQKKHILWENKNKGPEGKGKEPRKEKGMDESHQENELQRNRNWELSEGEGDTKSSRRPRWQCVTKKL